ncbi:MAG: uroporphyrinogen-III synthase [Sulfurimonas sp.]|nr:uroporphyrinogen-III synthase [Sulfurimonas sp.]
MKPYLFSTSSYPDTIHVNPLEISFLQTSINFTQYDYIIVTSKQAVKALSYYDKEDYQELQGVCISKATAKSFEDIGAKVLEIGGGYGDDLSQIISSYPKETKWLYLRAKVVASNFAEFSRANGYSIDEAIVYESKCSQSIQSVKIPPKATLIFTSPSSVKCFLKYHELKADKQVVVIGKTTAKALPSGIKTLIAQEPSIKSCLKIIYSL